MECRLVTQSAQTSSHDKAHSKTRRKSIAVAHGHQHTNSWGGKRKPELPSAHIVGDEARPNKRSPLICPARAPQALSGRGENAAACSPGGEVRGAATEVEFILGNVSY